MEENAISRNIVNLNLLFQTFANIGLDFGRKFFDLAKVIFLDTVNLNLFFQTFANIELDFGRKSFDLAKVVFLDMYSQSKLILPIGKC